MTPLEVAIATGARRTPINKALQLQLVTDVAFSDLKVARGGWGDVYAGNWCILAPPAPPDQDAAGKVTGACEVLGVQLGDQIVALGSRDVRWSKFSQDVQPGETVFHNAFSARLFFGQNIVSLSAGGGFITFDIAGKKVGLSGFPASPGGGAPYLSISTTAIGLVSADGKASVTVNGSQATVTGGAISLDANAVTLGQNPTDFVALAALVLARLTTIQAAFDSHTHAAGTITAPVGGGICAGITLSPNSAIGALASVASTKVKCL